MPTTIRFVDRRADGDIDCSVDIPGSPLPCILPPGLSAMRKHDEIRLQANDPAAAYAGRLSIPTLVGGQVRVFGLDIPPRPPWHWGALRSMHASVRRLELNAPSGGDLLRPEFTQPEQSRHGLEWEALNRCSVAAAVALSHWPTQLRRREIIHPLELPRGTEMIEATERRLGLDIDLVPGNRNGMAPVATIRRVGTVDPWTNRLLAAVTSQVCQTIRSAEGKRSFGETPERLVLPIQALAQRSRPTTPMVDPPFSSWPPVLSNVYATALAVLALATEGGREAGWVPLSDIWRTYEIWLAERTDAILRRILGPPAETCAGHRVCSVWNGTHKGSKWTLEMRHPCTFNSSPRSMAGRKWRSVSSELEPDIVLVADGPKGPGLIVLDAKAWSDKLSAGHLAQEASKYLWGIRRDGKSIRGTTAVVLVSPKGGDKPYNRAAAAQRTIHAYPHAAWRPSPGTVGTRIDSRFFRRLLRRQLGLPV